MYFWYTPSNSDWVLRPDWNNGYSKWVEFYSKDKTSLKFWSSYSALYNYLHGDQNAYLSSKIEETGQDIGMSIKDMDANLGNKWTLLLILLIVIKAICPLMNCKMLLIKGLKI